MCPSRSLFYTSPLGILNVAKCFSYRSLLLHPTASVNVSLELQGDCSDQLTLICKHSDVLTPPLWLHNRTVESGEVLGTAFPGASYAVLTRTEHTTTITGVDSVRALNGYFIQCAYDDLGNLIKSNAVQFSFIPPGQCKCRIQTTLHDVFT